MMELYLSIAVLLLLIIALIISLKRSSSESYGGFITPKEVMGAVRSGSTALGGAVEFAGPREECIRRCMGGLQGGQFMNETSYDERAQMCYGMC